MCWFSLDCKWSPKYDRLTKCVAFNIDVTGSQIYSFGAQGQHQCNGIQKNSTILSPSIEVWLLLPWVYHIIIKLWTMVSLEGLDLKRFENQKDTSQWDASSGDSEHMHKCQWQLFGMWRFFFSQYTWSALEIVASICFSVQAEQLLEWLPWHFHAPQRMSPTGIDDPWFSSGTISSCDIVNPPRHISFFLHVFFPLSFAVFN